MVARVVLSMNCMQTVYMYDLHHGEVMEFKLYVIAMKMIIYKDDSSTARLYTFPDHC
jgi:hypothetical protein